MKRLHKIIILSFIIAMAISIPFLIVDMVITDLTAKAIIDALLIGSMIVGTIRLTLLLVFKGK